MRPLSFLLPGAGFVLRGDLAIGFALAVPALLAVGVMLLSWAIATPGYAWPWAGGALLCYLGLAGLAAWWLTRCETVAPVDAAAVRAAFARLAADHLNGRDAQALGAAHELTVLAPHEPGAWRALALAARQIGDRHLEKRAVQRAERIEER